MQSGQEFLVGEASPFVGVECLVSGAADASNHLFGSGNPGEHGGNPVGQFHPGMGGRKNVGCDAAAVPEFRPEPLRGVGVAALGDELGTLLRGEGRDLRRLVHAGVVLPKPALRMHVAPPPRIQGERNIALVHRDRTGAGRVDADADHSFGREAPPSGRCGERPADGSLQPDQVIAGVLPGEMVVAGVQNDALVSADIGRHGGAEFRPVGTTHHECAHGIGAEIDSEGEHARGVIGVGQRIGKHAVAAERTDRPSSYLGH